MRKLSLGTLLVAAAMSPTGTAAPQDALTVLGSFEGTLTPGRQLRGFASEPEAEDAMLRVLRYAGLRPNFLFGRDDGETDAAAAGMALDPAGEDVRVIIYNGRFMRELRGATGTEWSQFLVLAHELGHHLQGHTLQSGGSHPSTELEADEYAGFLLNRMGATLDETLAGFATFPERGGGTHPGRRDRMRAATKGWNDAQRQMAGTRSGSSSSSSIPPPISSSAGGASPSAGAEAAREAIVQLEAALGDRLDEVEEILRNDLDRLSADVTGALAASEARVVGAAGAREPAEAVRAAASEEARLTREAVTQASADVRRVMWVLVAFSAVALPLLMLVAFKRPPRQLVRVVERASTRARSRVQTGARSLIRRDSDGVPRVPRGGRGNGSRLPAASRRKIRMAAAKPALMLVAARRRAGATGRDIRVSDGHLRPGAGGFLIGRHAPAVHGVADDPTVSRKHARIAREEGRIVIEDLGSSNGTLVNGVRLRPGEKRVLRSGDSVQLGGMRAFSVRAT